LFNIFCPKITRIKKSLKLTDKIKHKIFSRGAKQYSAEKRVKNTSWHERPLSGPEPGESRFRVRQGERRERQRGRHGPPGRPVRAARRHQLGPAAPFRPQLPGASFAARLLKPVFATKSSKCMKTGRLFVRHDFRGSTMIATCDES